MFFLQILQKVDFKGFFKVYPVVPFQFLVNLNLPLLQFLLIVLSSSIRTDFTDYYLDRFFLARSVFVFSSLHYFF